MLSAFGVDLSEWLEAGRWRALLELIDQLPRTSRLSEARVNDPEEAAQIAAQLNAQKDKDDADHSPALSDFDQTASMLADVIDLLKVLIGTTVSAAGGKPDEVQPYPRPRTRVQDELAKIERALGGQLLKRWGFDPDDI